MAIGGLKEKLLAAHRAGITTVIIPRENRKDLREVPRRVLKATRIILVEHADEVLREALCLSDADALFGPPRESWEYVDGELVVKNGAKPAAIAPAPGAEHPTPPTGNA
jgi:ATP-dependent Lon protease